MANIGTITTPPQHRANQNDQVGGTGLDDVAVAWSNGWSQTFLYETTNLASFVARVREGRGAIITGSYAAMPSSKRYSATFRGGHAVYINEELETGYFWGLDPLFKAPTIYTAQELQDYMYALVLSGTSGRAHFGYTRVIG